MPVFSFSNCSALSMLAAVHTPLPGLVSVKGMTSAPFTPFMPSCALTPVALTSAVMTVAFICRVFRSTMTAAVALALLVTAGITSLPVRVAENILSGTVLLIAVT